MFSFRSFYSDAEKQMIDVVLDKQVVSVYSTTGVKLAAFTFNGGYTTMWSDDDDGFTDIPFEASTIEERLKIIARDNFIKDLYDFETYKKLFSKLEAEDIQGFCNRAGFYTIEDVD